MTSLSKFKFGPEGLEIDGSEEFIEKMFDKCKEIISLTNFSQVQKTNMSPLFSSLPLIPEIVEENENTEDIIEEIPSNKAKRKTPRKKSLGRNTTSVKIEEVDFESHGYKVSNLHEFLTEKTNNKTSNIIKATVITYFLIKNLGYTSVNIGHINKCCELMGVHKFSPQTMIDAKNKKRWLTGNSSDGFALTYQGDNYVLGLTPKEKE